MLLYTSVLKLQEIVDNPQLFVEGATPNDVTQGILGNCWFVSACSALTHNQTLLKKVCFQSCLLVYRTEESKGCPEANV